MEIEDKIQYLKTHHCPNRCIIDNQGGRTWQPFVGGKNGHENFRQARIYNFRDKFVHNRKFANLAQ